MVEQQNSLKLSVEKPELNYVSQETVPAEVETRIPNIQQRFFFHELMRDSNKRRHYIVEDIEVDPATLPDPEAPLFYYLRQDKFDNPREFEHAKRYYNKIYEYCKTVYAKSDIVRLNYVYDYTDEKENYYEIVTILDYGEADRIDIESISTNHINKFLKNVCLLLTELNSFDAIYNGNIFLKNIILVDGELKLSGFKPLYLEDDAGEGDWKIELAKRHGPFRLDLYLMGLLWLTFLNIKLQKIIPKEAELVDVVRNVKRIVMDLPDDKRMEIITKLIDIDKYPDLTLEEVILDFDEYYILENIKIEESTVNNRQTVPFDSASSKKYKSPYKEEDVIGDMDSEGEIEKIDKKESKPNLFKKSLKDSEINNNVSVQDDKATARMFNSNEREDLVNIDGRDFTLKDKGSVNEQQDQIMIRNGQDSIFGGGEQKEQLNRKATDPTHLKFVSGSKADEKHRSLKISDDNTNNSLQIDSGAIRKLKSDANFVNVKIREELSSEVIEDEKNQESENKSEGTSHPNYSFQNNHFSENEAKWMSKDLKVPQAETEQTEEPVLLLKESDQKKNPRISFEFENNNVNQVSLLSKKSEEKNASYFTHEESEVIDTRRISKDNRKLFSKENSENKSDDLKRVKEEDEVSDDDEDSVKNDFEIELAEEDLKSEEDEKIYRESLKKESFELEELSKTIENDIIRTSFSRQKQQTLKDQQAPLQSIEPIVEERSRRSLRLQNIQPVKLEEPPKKKIKLKSANKKKKFKKQPVYTKNGYLNEWDEELARENKEKESSEFIKQEMKLVEARLRRENAEKRQRQLEKMMIKDDERRLEEQILRDRIDRVLQEKLEQKEKKKREERRLQREKSQELEAKKLKKTKNTTSAYLRRSVSKGRRLNRSYSRSTSNLKSAEKIDENFKRINTDMKKKLKMSSMEARNKLFTYNNKLTNKNVSYKDLLEKPDTHLNPKPKIQVKGKRKRKQFIPEEEDSDKDSYDNFPGFETHQKEISKSKDKNVKDLIYERRKQGNNTKSKDNEQALKINTQKPEKVERIRKQFKPFKSIVSDKNQESDQKIDIQIAQDMHGQPIAKNEFVQKKIETRNEPFKRKIKTKKASIEQRNNTKRSVDRLSDKKRSVDRFSDTRMSADRISIRSKDKIGFVRKVSAHEKIDRGSIRAIKTKLNSFEEEQKIQQAHGMGLVDTISRESEELDIDITNKTTFIKANETRVEYEVAVRRSRDRKQNPSFNTKAQRKRSNRRSSSYQGQEQIFNDNLDKCKDLIENGKYKEASKKLEQLLKEVNKVEQKLEIYSLLGTLHIKNDDYAKSILYLKKQVNCLEKNTDVENRDTKLKGALMTLAVCQIKAKRFFNAQESLEHNIFNNKQNVPAGYFNLMGDVYNNVGLYDDAYDIYRQQFKQMTSKRMNEASLQGFYNLISKMVIVLNTAGNNEEIIRLYKEVLGMTDKLARVNNTLDSGIRMDHDIQENVVASIVGVLMGKKNRTMTSFVLSDIINNETIDYDNLDDEDRLRFIDFYLNFALYLKGKENYGGHKQVYINYLEEAHRILKKCEKDDLTLKKELFIVFNKGLYFLSEKQYSKARTCFERSLSIYHTYMPEPDDELFTILYNIAVSLYKLKEYKDCPYFFEKIRELGCKDINIGR